MIKIKNLPNYLTIFRISIIPLIVASFYFKSSVFFKRLAAILFLLACLTDFLDGWLARRFNLESSLGEMLDPLADKILVISLLFMLVKYNDINVIPCILIAGREVAVSGLRAAAAKFDINLKVKYFAKLKTFIQMSSLFLFLLGDVGTGINHIDKLASILLWLSAIMTLQTGYRYFEEYTKKIPIESNNQ